MPSREAAGGAAWPGAGSRPLCLPLSSSPFTNFSHVPAACAAAADPPVGRPPRIVCSSSGRSEMPRGTREPPRPRAQPGRDQHAPGALPFPGVPIAEHALLSGRRAPGTALPPSGLSFLIQKNEGTKPRDYQGPFSVSTLSSKACTECACCVRRVTVPHCHLPPHPPRPDASAEDE